MTEAEAKNGNPDYTCLYAEKFQDNSWLVLIGERYASDFSRLLKWDLAIALVRKNHDLTSLIPIIAEGCFPDLLKTCGTEFPSRKH